AGRGRGPGVHQRHLHHVIQVAAVAYERAAIANVNVHLGNLVEVVGIVRVTVTHDVIGDDGIDLDAGDVTAAVGHRALHVHSAAGTDDGVVAIRTQHIGQGRRGCHEVALVRGIPVVRIGIHEVGAGIGINHNDLGPALLIHLYPR